MSIPLSTRVKPTLTTIKPYVPGKPIDEVKREFNLKKIVKLASNENPYPPSPKVLSAIEKNSLLLNRYPDADCFELRLALGELMQVDPKKIILGNGSDELIVLAARCLLGVGDEVVIAQPSFLIYDIASRLEGATVRAVPLLDFRYDLKSMKSQVNEKTRLVFLGNPDNPSGWYFTQKEIENFMEGVPEDVLVFLDEAYYEYVDRDDYVDSISLLEKHSNLIVTRTFSKLYGLAGLRIGYGVGHPEFVSYLQRLREPFNVNSLAQAAALACLKDKVYYRKVQSNNLEQRDYLLKALANLGCQTVPTVTNFILIDTLRSASEVTTGLLERGVIVRDMSVWGMPQHIRVSIGKENENLFFLKHLKDVFSKVTP